MRHSEKGITLVETVVSILLFSIIGASILRVAVDSMSMGKRSEFAYTAYNLAKNHLETLRALPYSTLTNAAESNLYMDSTGVANVDGPYTRTTAVTTSYTGDANLVQVTVSVNYFFRGQLTSNPTQLTTVMFQYG